MGGQVTRCYVARQEAGVFEIYLVLLLGINNRVLDSISGYQFIRNSSIILSRIRRFDKLLDPAGVIYPNWCSSKIRGKKWKSSLRFSRKKTKTKRLEEEEERRRECEK